MPRCPDAPMPRCPNAPISQSSNPEILERTQALRRKTSHLCGKFLENLELVHGIHQRNAELLSRVSATQKKTMPRWALNLNRIQFLKIDLDVALTFARIALQSHSNNDKRARNRANARKAYDTVVHWMSRLEIGQPDALEIDAKLKKLIPALEILGERL